MTPWELKERLEKGEEILLLDVREPEEVSIASIGGKHIPLGDLSQRFHELDPEKEVIVLCHHGVRSSHAVSFLRSQGFSKAKNLSGGIEQWSLDIDPTVMRY